MAKSTGRGRGSHMQRVWDARDESARRAIGEKVRTKQAGKPKSEETRARMSAGAKARWAKPEERAQQAARLEGQPHPWVAERQRGQKQNPATTEKIADANRGQKRTPEQRAKISVALTGKKRTVEQKIANARRTWGHKVEWLSPDGHLYRFRSTWERIFAQRLTAAGMTWLYEPHALLLSDGRVYLPDFWVEDWGLYIEIKGWAGKRTIEKCELAKADGHPVLMVDDPNVGFGLPAGCEVT